MIHLYLGNGKGKSTAAIGLVVRLLNYEKRILLLSFLKNGQSGELVWLRHHSEIQHRYQVGWSGFVKDLDDKQYQEAKTAQLALLKAAIREKDNYDVIILDEFTDLISVGFLDVAQAVSLIRELASTREVVITGHEIFTELVAIADYYTEFTEHKHPFKKGIKARIGVEY